MPSVRIREGESADSAIRRFKRAVEKSGLPKELRKREHHKNGSTIRKHKAAAARKRHLKKLQRESLAMLGGASRRPQTRVIRSPASARSTMGRGQGH